MRRYTGLSANLKSFMAMTSNVESTATYPTTYQRTSDAKRALIWMKDY
jgi:hypothetical protein